MASAIRKNLPFIKQQFSAALGNSSVVVKAICVVVFLAYFLTFSSSAVSVLVVTPGKVLPPNVWAWTFVTFSFMELHIWLVLLDIIVMVLCGKLIEPLWGALEMLIFFVVVNFFVAVVTTFVYLFIYFLSRNEDYLFDTQVYGLAGYLAAFAVSVKQIMPDHILVNSSFGKLRNRHIPLLLINVVIVIRLFGVVDGPYPIMFGTGIVVSWIYLRFYQKHSNGNRGDMADSFTFASFFPELIRTPIAVLSNTIFSFFVKIKVCKKPQRKYDVSSPSTITVSLPGTDPQDSERRRQLALKALNERLSKQEQPAQWPSMDDIPESPTPSVPSVTTTAANPESPVPAPVPEFKLNMKELDLPVAGNEGRTVGDEQTTTVTI
ncbi:transmembrane protein 115-like [Tubulanus polymorphus]|uniref:transmembrane protein 115-like n=1 Tax=Tubulanus polymorphus TaxID=672921 RepID=UPI003DA59F3D